jgi:hypothetical protein
MYAFKQLLAAFNVGVAYSKEACEMLMLASRFRHSAYDHSAAVVSKHIKYSQGSLAATEVASLLGLLDGDSERECRARMTKAVPFAHGLVNNEKQLIKL